MFHKKPYLKNIDNISGMKVWLVDGQYIRNNIDKEFTNFGQHYCFKFIPFTELWIDKENDPGEEKYFIDHLLVEHKLMAQGLNYEQALDRADIVERKERNKSKIVKRWSKKNNKELIARNVHQKLISVYSIAQVKTWLVDGQIVRDFFCIDFTEGGHDLVYSFVPQGEIWLDNDNNPAELKFIFLHELHERNLMLRGWTYDRAHRNSSRLEYRCRQHPNLINKKIAQEIKKIK